MPLPGHIFLGSISMCINYLWVSCAVVWFLLLYNHIGNGDTPCKRWKNICLFMVALIVGSLQESFTIGLSGAFFIYYCFHINEFKGSVRWLVLGFWIGTAIVTWAPGNFVRMEVEKTQNIFVGITRYTKNIISLVIETKLLLGVIFLSMILSVKNSGGIKNFLSKNTILLLSMIIEALVVILVYSGARQLTSIELFALILLVKMLYEFGGRLVDKYHVALEVLMVVILLIVYVPVYGYRRDGFVAYKNLYETKVVDSCIVNDSYFRIQREHQKAFLSSRYTYQVDFEDWVYRGFSLMKSDGREPYLVKAILPISQDSIIKLFDEKRHENGIYHNEKDGYYIIERPADMPITKCLAWSEPVTCIGKWRNSVMGYSNDYRIDVTQNLRWFERDGNLYYVFYKPHYKVFNLSVE